MRKVHLYGIIVSVSIVLALFVSALPAYALDTFKLYDNFKSRYINPNKWYGAQSGPIREIGREITGGALAMSMRATGGSNSWNGLYLVNPNSVTSMRATINVDKESATACPDIGSADVVIRASLGGNFFNIGTPVPGCYTDDMTAYCWVARSSGSTAPASTLGVQCSVLHRKDCGGSVDVVGIKDLGTVEAGTPVALTVWWDQPNKRFVFKRDAQANVAISYKSFYGGAVQLPGNPFKVLLLHTLTLSCSSQTNPTVYSDTIFDNVYVNASAVTSAFEESSEDETGGQE